MKVNDFSKRLGIGSSKVRYYDRIGLIKGGRAKRIIIVILLILMR